MQSIKTTQPSEVDDACCVDVETRQRPFAGEQGNSSWDPSMKMKKREERREKEGQDALRTGEARWEHGPVISRRRGGGMGMGCPSNVRLSTFALPSHSSSMEKKNK